MAIPDSMGCISLNCKDFVPHSEAWADMKPGSSDVM